MRNTTIPHERYHVQSKTHTRSHQLCFTEQGDTVNNIKQCPQKYRDVSEQSRSALAETKTKISRVRRGIINAPRTLHRRLDDITKHPGARLQTVTNGIMSVYSAL